MGKVRTEAELISFAKELLPIIDELRDIQKRSGVTMIQLCITGDSEERAGNNEITVQAEPDALDVLYIKAVQHRHYHDPVWHYRLDSSLSHDDLRGTF